MSANKKRKTHMKSFDPATGALHWDENDTTELLRLVREHASALRQLRVK